MARKTAFDLADTVEAGTDTLQTRILIVDDHAVVREGLRQLIEQEPDLHVCGFAESVREALSAIAQTHPDLVLVDISLRGPNGIELIKSMKQMHPDLLSLVLSMHEDSLYAERALRAGSRGYVMKHEAADELLTAIRKVLAGEIHVSARMGNAIIGQFVNSPDTRSGVDRLSDRELEILQLMGGGRGTRQIADDLNLSVKTVESHRARMKEKLKIREAPELIRFAVRWVSERAES